MRGNRGFSIVLVLAAVAGVALAWAGIHMYQKYVIPSQEAAESIEPLPEDTLLPANSAGSIPLRQEFEGASIR